MRLVSSFPPRGKPLRKRAGLPHSVDHYRIGPRIEGRPPALSGLERGLDRSVLVSFQEIQYVFVIQRAVLGFPEAMAGLEDQVEFAAAVSVGCLGRIFGFHEAIFRAMDDQHVALITGDVLVDVISVIKALVIGAADAHAHESNGVGHVGQRGIARETIVRNAQSRVNEQDGPDAVFHPGRRDGRHAAALAFAQQKDVGRIHAVPTPHRFQHVHQILPLRENGHVLRTPLAPAPRRTTGKVVAIAHIARLSQGIGQRIETLVRTAVAVRQDHGRMPAGRLGNEGLAINPVAAAHAGYLPHLIRRIGRRSHRPSRLRKHKERYGDEQGAKQRKQQNLHINRYLCINVFTKGWPTRPSWRRGRA